MKHRKTLAFIYILLSAFIAHAQIIVHQADTLINPGFPVTLNLGEHRGAVQWEASSDGENWNPINGEATDSLVIPKTIQGTRYYRAALSEANCATIYSPVSMVAQPQQNYIRIDKCPIIQYELATINLDWDTFDQDSLLALIDNKRIDVRKINDTLATCLVNDTIGGVRELQIMVGDQLYSTYISISKRDSIELPGDYVQGWRDHLVIEETISAFDSLMLEFNKLSIEQQQITASIIKANCDHLNEVKTLIDFSFLPVDGTKAPSSCISPDSMNRAMKAYVQAVGITTIGTAIPVLAGTAVGIFLSPATMGISAVSGAMVGGLFSYMIMADAWRELGRQGTSLSTGIFQAFAIMVKDLAKSGNSEFYADSPVSLNYSISTRNIQKTDKNNTDHIWISEFITKFSSVIKYWDEYMSEEPNPPAFALQQSVENTAESINMLSLNILNNDYVSGIISGTPDNLMIEFSKKYEYSDERFEYSITYDDGYFSITSDPINAVVRTNEPYSIEVVSGDHQNGNPDETLSEPIVVLVKDINGNPFENAEVKFSINEGSVSSTKVFTDASGYASVDWHLGKNAMEQTLAIECKFDYGRTHIEGSPLTVTSTLYDCNGDLGGSAYLDICNTCVGGNTGVQDCSTEWKTSISMPGIIDETFYHVFNPPVFEGTDLHLRIRLSINAEGEGYTAMDILDGEGVSHTTEYSEPSNVPVGGLIITFYGDGEPIVTLTNRSFSFYRRYIQDPYRIDEIGVKRISYSPNL
jgi:hypothetical protein